MAKTTEQPDSFANISLHAADVIQDLPEDTRVKELAGEGVEPKLEPTPAAAATTPATPAAAAQAQALAALEPPAMWPQAAKDAWLKLQQATPDARTHAEQLHNVYNQTQSYVKQVEQQNAEYRRHFEPIGQVLQPYVQQWQRDGIDVTTGLRQLLSWNDMMNQDPQNAILQLAQRFGVDLNQALAEAPYVDPMVQQLQQRIAQQEERWQQASLQQTQQQQQFILANVQAFEQEKDAQGQLKHPHFAEVLPHMQALASMGHAKTAEEAYELAVRYNPRLQAQAAQAAAAEAVKRTQAANAQVAQTVQRGVARTRPERGSDNDSGRSLKSLIGSVMAEHS